MNNRTVLDAYAQVDIGAAVAAASPHGLISMLMSGSLKRMMEAKGAIARGNFSSQGLAISKAISIIGELQGSLRDVEKNEVAGNLDRLYDYMVLTLVKANAESSEAKIDEVAQLMMQIKSGWDGLEAQA